MKTGILRVGGHAIATECSDDEEEPPQVKQTPATATFHEDEKKTMKVEADATPHICSRRTNPGHPMLSLEGYVHELDRQTAENARLYFACVKANNALAKYAKEELMSAFAPLEQRNMEPWERSLSLQDVFAEAIADMSALLRLEEYVNELGERESGLARLYFDAIRNNSPFAGQAMSELEKLFEPLERRTAEEWKATDSLRTVFVALRRQEGNEDW